jgi:hypothetical protein
VHLGIHLAGVHSEEPDAAAFELGRPDPAQMVEGRLGHAVRAPAGIGRQARVGGDVQDETAAAQRHGSGQGLGETERAHQVHGQDPLEVLTVGVEQQRQRRPAQGAGVVDQDVHRPHQRGRGAGDAVDLLLLAHVAREGVGLAAGGTDPRRHALQLVPLPAPPGPPAPPRGPASARAPRPAPRLAPVTIAAVPRTFITALLVSSKVRDGRQQKNRIANLLADG